ncbi:hypothetical protein BJF85_12805 [Saccharomonospora sp. CUA-673]|uniref:hypothetical protein n=1 Tax=Saccharomonospora sp. CUA-673 TaxID=1904969 RepID=UPI000969F55C|nr:hypothetical protein [Saccharomonospora sp. CUA-673]OLT48393.1 hypothetical protein BJF85_12805 [Saccharomonospora sp. CUA-673]
MSSGDGTQAAYEGDALIGSEPRHGQDPAGTQPPPQPTAPDLETLRSKVAAALAEEDALQQAASGETPADAEAGENADPGAPSENETTQPQAATPGAPGQRRIVPRLRGQLMPAMLRRGRKSTVAKPLNERLTQVRRPSNASTGLFVALVLCIVFVLVAIQFVVSFIDSITSLLP